MDRYPSVTEKIMANSKANAIQPRALLCLRGSGGATDVNDIKVGKSAYVFRKSSPHSKSSVSPVS